MSRCHPKRILAFSLTLLLFLILAVPVFAWTPKPVADDPLLRMPGTQPDQGVTLEAPGRCLNCHSGYNASVEPGFNWKGSMMAQAARDPIFWACMTVAAQDSIWALGNPNAVDLCERCHFPEGWLGGRSDPPNASAMTQSDYDGLHCDFCHKLSDPFFETTQDGSREGSDWSGYWDEQTPLSSTEADRTYTQDAGEAGNIKLFTPGNFFINNRPKYSRYGENGSGQYFVSADNAKRASFADAGAKHQMLYSRYHKSKYFCSTCHDVSNPALANLGLSGLADLSGGTDLISEQYSAFNYFHVERTFSEFMLSAYGRQGGAATNPEFQDQGAPDIATAAKCQDCHMRDVSGPAANKNSAVDRPAGSNEHPASGLPLHDLTGGNSWITRILASLDPTGPVYDPRNVEILNQGPAALTLDLSQGVSPTGEGAALKAGSDRALQQLQLAATIKDLTYDSASGTLSFKVQNNSGHKLISGFPEGRRMFLNVKAFKGGSLLAEINPYSDTAGTLKGLSHPSSPALGSGESHDDALVYEVHPSSTLTGEEQTFHFVLATGRSKDNRIPPKGFDIVNAAERHSEPVWHGVIDPDYFSSAEYAGGYDQVDLTIPAGADQVTVNLYYQGTSREYIEFLRDEINGTGGTLTLNGQGQNPAGGTETYVVQSDPFFTQLKAWGNAIWDLWEHNHGLDSSGVTVPGIVPTIMASAAWGGAPPCDPPVPTLLSAEPGHTNVALAWTDLHTTDNQVLGYNLYYDQAGKSQLVAEVGQIATYTDSGLTNGQSYCYKLTSRYADCESTMSNILCATPTNQSGGTTIGAASLVSGVYEPSGKGKNRTTVFVQQQSFQLGDAIILRAHVIDQASGAPVADAVVEFTVSGPETATVTSTPSYTDGYAEGTWSTSAPNRKGNGGTPPGSYTATVSNVTLSGATWDGLTVSTSFSLQ
ncbi:MAG: hypothetical protein C0616_09550 [Desulfuromonas sp.]|nr:MAG: hypothetical protein C0616_09550 [Desulfuromonas sp.]